MCYSDDNYKIQTVRNVSGFIGGLDGYADSYIRAESREASWLKVIVKTSGD